MVKRLILSLMRNKRDQIDEIFEACSLYHRVLFFNNSLERARLLLAFVPARVLANQLFVMKCLAEDKEVYLDEE